MTMLSDNAYADKYVYRQESSYTLLYEELDEKNVEIVRILGFSANSPDTRYLGLW
jgi:hypothetical protein